MRKPKSSRINLTVELNICIEGQKIRWILCDFRLGEPINISTRFHRFRLCLSFFSALQSNQLQKLLKKLEPQQQQQQYQQP